MIIIKSLLLLIIPILFTACAPFLQKDGYYTGEKAVKMNYGVILASATAGNNFGSALYSSIVLVNINTGEKFDLQNKVCRIKKDTSVIYIFGRGGKLKEAINHFSNPTKIKESLEKILN